jgi:hypothetical protein
MHMPAACLVAFCSLVTGAIAHGSMQISGHMMCNYDVLDSQKLGFSSHQVCYDHRQIDKNFYRQSLYYHPDKHTQDSSDSAFNCLQEARQRLKMKMCQVDLPATSFFSSVCENVHAMSFYIAFAMVMLGADVNEAIILGFVWMTDLNKLPHVMFLWRATPLILDIFSLMQRGKDLKPYNMCFE